MFVEHSFHFYFIRKETNKLIIRTLILLSLFVVMFKTPSFLGIDELILERSKDLQVKTLRRSLTVDVLKSFKELEVLNKLYDEKYSDPNTQLIVASKIAEETYKILYSSNGIAKLPLSKVKTFVSSANRLREGNWMQEPLILGHEMGEDLNKSPYFYYKPRLLLFSSNIDVKFMSFSDWNNEIIFKDKYGNTISRKDFIISLYKGKSEILPSEHQKTLEIMRQFPDDQVVFKSYGGSELNVQNSIINSYSRAISEELIRSYNSMQKILSNESLQ